MKFFQSFFIVTLVIFGFSTTQHASAFASGTGVMGDPYIIETCGDMFSINGSPSSYYLLANDLDCTADGNSLRLTGPGTDFTGNFNGGGHTITVNINTSFGNTSVFSSVLGGTITDVHIAGAVTSSTADNVAGIVAYANEATISRVVNSATITAGGSRVGGIIGDMVNSSLSDSYNTGSIMGTGTLGGVIGFMDDSSSVSKVYNRGVVGASDTSLYHVGGITGWRNGTTTTMLNSFNVGQVLTSQSTFFFGGLWGNDQSGDAGVPSAGLSNNFFDEIRSTRSMCGYANDGSAVNDTLGACTGVNSDGNGYQYFKNNSTSAPLDTWDFGTIWETNTGGYPSLQSIVGDGGSVSDEPGFAGGNGTEETPYQIGTCEQLKSVNSYLDSFFVLTTDLDCTADGNEILLGSDADPFTGDFDGDDYEITVNISLNESEVGLFREIDGATIRHLKVAGTVIGGDNYVGGIVGYAINSDILNSSSSVSVTGTLYDVGGIAGHFENGSMENSFATGTVTGTDEESEQVGGLVGHLDDDGAILESYATGYITGYRYVGGLVGEMEDGTVTDSYATGTVSGTTRVGGLVGRYDTGDDSSKIFHSYATGNVTGTEYVGGLAGYLRGVVSQSYATGDVNGTSTGQYIGGLVGYINEDAVIRDSYTRSSVTDDENNYVGGFSGYIDSGTEIFNSYTAGIFTSSATFRGGFSGYNNGGDVYNLFWDTQVSGMSQGCAESTCSSEVAGKTTAQMKQQSTFTNTDWDFDAIWDIASMTNNGYPYLLGGEDIIPTTPNNSPVQGPVETILDENQFHGGGVRQEWNGDDDVWEYELPFSFNFYGVDYTTAYVSSNGYIGFTSDTGDYAFDIEDGADTPLITAMAKDMRTDVDDDDDIYITDNGDGQVIFRWQATDYDNEDSISNFEIVLHDDGKFEITYGDQTEPLDYAPPVGVHDGDQSYVASYYDGRTDFDNLMTSAWEWEATSTPARSAAPTIISSGGPRITWSPATESKKAAVEAETPKDDTLCSTDQLLSQNLKTGARNGRYHAYTKTIVKQAHILQGHLNRLGFNSGLADGILGPISDGAIKRMQTFLGTKADGYVGPITRDLINKSCGSKGLLSR